MKSFDAATLSEHIHVDQNGFINPSASLLMLIGYNFMVATTLW